MRTNPYYGLFLCGLNKRFSNEIKTAGVCFSGINHELIINKDWWYSLDNDMREAVLHHEVLHICFYHTVDGKMWGSLCNYDPHLLNIAMDQEVNSYLDYKKLKGFGTAEKLFKEFPNLPRKMGTKFYIKFLQQIQKYKPGDPENEYMKGGNIANAQAIIKGDNDLDNHDNFGSESSDAENELRKNQIDYQQKETANNIIKSRGIIPGELEEKLKQLLTSPPPIFNWKLFFRRLLGITFDIFKISTRRKESKRFPDSPGLITKKKHKLLVAIDTSGSINQDELNEFFSEIKYIWKAGADVKILECDMNITKEYDYKGKTPETVSGRGGTSFKSPIEYYNKHYKEYTSMVYFTDGYGDQDECKPNKKMMWIITSEGNQESNYPGIKICIPKKINHEY